MTGSDNFASSYPIPMHTNPQAAAGHKRFGVFLLDLPGTNWENSTVGNQLNMTAEMVKAHMRSTMQDFAEAVQLSSFGKMTVSSEVAGPLTISEDGAYMNMKNWYDRSLHPTYPNTLPVDFETWWNYPHYASLAFYRQHGAAYNLTNADRFTENEVNGNARFDYLLLVFPPGAFDAGMSSNN